MDLVIPLIVLIAVSAVLSWAVMRTPKRSMRRDPVLLRAQQRATRSARAMIAPPPMLGAMIDGNQPHQIGVALAEHRLDDAIALWSHATGQGHADALQVIDRWMDEGTRISLVGPRAAAPPAVTPEWSEPTLDSPWPELPRRNTEPGSPSNDLR